MPLSTILNSDPLRTSEWEIQFLINTQVPVFNLLLLLILFKNSFYPISPVFFPLMHMLNVSPMYLFLRSFIGFFPYPNIFPRTMESHPTVAWERVWLQLPDRDRGGHNGALSAPAAGVQLSGVPPRSAPFFSRFVLDLAARRVE